MNLRFLLILLIFATHRCGVSASGKSGKSEDNKKRVLSLAEQILQFVLSTDNHDFTDVCYAARHQGHQGHQWLKQR